MSSQRRRHGKTSALILYDCCKPLENENQHTNIELLIIYHKAHHVAEVIGRRFDYNTDVDTRVYLDYLKLYKRIEKELYAIYEEDFVKSHNLGDTFHSKTTDKIIPFEEYNFHIKKEIIVEYILCRLNICVLGPTDVSYDPSSPNLSLNVYEDPLPETFNTNLISLLNSTLICPAPEGLSQYNIKHHRQHSICEMIMKDYIAQAQKENSEFAELCESTTRNHEQESSPTTSIKEGTGVTTLGSDVYLDKTAVENDFIRVMKTKEIPEKVVSAVSTIIQREQQQQQSRAEKGNPRSPLQITQTVMVSKDGKARVGQETSSPKSRVIGPAAQQQPTEEPPSPLNKLKTSISGDSLPSLLSQQQQSQQSSPMVNGGLCSSRSDSALFPTQTLPQISHSRAGSRPGSRPTSATDKLPLQQNRAKASLSFAPSSPEINYSESIKVVMNNCVSPNIGMSLAQGDCKTSQSDARTFGQKSFLKPLNQEFAGLKLEIPATETTSITSTTNTSNQPTACNATLPLLSGSNLVVSPSKAYSLTAKAKDIVSQIESTAGSGSGSGGGKSPTRTTRRSMFVTGSNPQETLPLPSPTRKASVNLTGLKLSPSMGAAPSQATPTPKSVTQTTSPTAFFGSNNTSNKSGAAVTTEGDCGGLSLSGTAATLTAKSKLRRRSIGGVNQLATAARTNGSTNSTLAIGETSTSVSSNGRVRRRSLGGIDCGTQVNVNAPTIVTKGGVQEARARRRSIVPEGLGIVKKIDWTAGGAADMAVDSYAMQTMADKIVFSEIK